jgi:hypothetical protein
VIVEVFTFRLAPDVSESDVLAADALVQTDFYYQRPGMVRRTTARSVDGAWVVVVFWGSEADAQAAGEAAADHEATERFAALMDHGTVRVTRYESLD